MTQTVQGIQALSPKRVLLFNIIKNILWQMYSNMKLTF